MRVDVSGSYVFPCPVVLLTCRGAGGKANIITLAWVGVACSDPPMVTAAIRPQRYSHDLVVSAQEFVLNVPSSEQLSLVDFCGSNSGRSVDKFEACGFTAVDGGHVDAPYIEECGYAIECRVEHTLHLGTHDMFVAEVIAAHADDAYVGQKGKLDYAKLSPLSYCPDLYFSLGQQVGRYGMSKKEG